MPLTPINAPIATSAPQAGISSEMKASDSPNASSRTIGAAQSLMVAHEIGHGARKILHALERLPGPSACLSKALNRSAVPMPKIR